MTPIEFIAVFVLLSALAYAAFVISLWYTINYPAESEKSTFAYKLMELRSATDELKEEIGKPFIPIFEKVIQEIKERMT